MEINNTVTIRRADIARSLIHMGYQIVDIKKDREFPSTDFVFANTDTFADSYKAVLEKLHLTDDDPSYKKKPFRGGYKKNTVVGNEGNNDL